ncbi:ATP-binding protein [Peredibacter starrii]|uniref:histidine kinase n=1 Tax=Peredibacter starrii TaxID=28202 RepID=A0AAX4HL08_9BACT|nr:ATP-binding protein [Peredibacter starrii]WPU63885.1 ATP-binding protein [Peredibacter starrii]
MKWWKNLSVSKKLFGVIGFMGLMIAVVVIMLVFALKTMSAVRAFVAGESDWSKGQKDSLSALQNYLITKDVKFYRIYLERIDVPLGDQRARLEMEKRHMNPKIAADGLIRGKVHPDDIPEVIKFYRRFHQEQHLVQAVKAWRKGDVYIDEMESLGKEIYNKYRQSGEYSPKEFNVILERISDLNDNFTAVETEFSKKIGAASRWLENVILWLLVTSVILIQGSVVLLTFSFSSSLTRALKQFNFVTTEVGKGNFSEYVEVNSKDELGQLANSINEMIVNLRYQIHERIHAEESETKMKRLANSMPQIVFVLDANGECQFYNARWWTFIGMTPQDPKTVKFTDYIHPDDKPLVMHNCREALSEHRTYTGEYRLRDRKGNYRWYLERCVPLLDIDGKVVQWFGTATDIHDLKFAREELQKAVNIRDEFLSVASHELKTPLTSLKLQFQLRKRYIDKGEIARFTPEKIHSMTMDDEMQLNHLVRLVDDMLDVSRLRTGKFNLQPSKFNMTLMLNEVLNRFTPQIQETGSEVSLDAPSELVGNWDRFRLEQVFTNLLTNAMKYGNNKPISVRLIEEDNRVKLMVTDQGRGIAPKDVERIFEQFERAIAYHEVSGLGLGLYITRQIVIAHNGSINVSSEIGKGTTFTVVLPMV